jgi:pimeloyl-ACP methyl ester carboxylesterase
MFATKAKVSRSCSFYITGVVRRAPWGEVIKRLENDFRCIAYDHRGWGNSDAPPSGYRIEDLAHDAEGLIRKLGLRRYVLVGHSMGGKVAQLLASWRPPGLEGLLFSRAIAAGSDGCS